MRGVAQRIGRVSPLAVLVTAWTLVIVAAFPGQMSPDCYEHLIEARYGFYTDGHPPVINVLFRLSDLIVAGPLGILVLETGCFLAGLYAILRRAMPDRSAAWLAAALFVFPPISTTLLVVWKDSVMAGFLMLGIAGLLDPRRGARIAGLVAIFAATAVRYNAFAATFPLVVLLFELRPRQWWLRRYAISFAAWLSITFAAFTVNSLLVDREMHYWYSSLAPHDIVGALVRLPPGVRPTDNELEALLAGTGLLVHNGIHHRMRWLYTPKNSMGLVSRHDPNALWNLPLYGTEPAPESQRDAIARVWKHVVTTYPDEYLLHRRAVMIEVLALTGKPAHETTLQRKHQYGATMLAAGLSDRASALQHLVTDGANGLNDHTPAFKPWIYAVLALVMLAFTRRHRDAFAVLASGIVIESSLFVLAPAPDFRYSHWMVTATCVSIVLLIARRARRQLA